MGKSNIGRNIIIVLLVLLVLSMLGIGGFFAFRAQAIIGTNDYECPENKVCTVIPILDCTQPILDPEVVFRRSDTSNKPQFFAVDTDNDGSLEPYNKRTSKTGGCNSEDKIMRLPEPDEANFVYKYNSIIRICDPYTGLGLEYEWGGDISTQKTPLSGEECNTYDGLIKCVGDINRFSCSRDIYKTGDILLEIIEHHGGSPTDDVGKRGGTYYISGGEHIYVGSGGTGAIRFDVEVQDQIITECIVDTDGGSVTLSQGQSTCVDQNTLITCIDPPQTIEEYRDPSETSSRCVNNGWEDAYTVSLVIEKDVISVGEKFVIHFDLNDPIYTQFGREVKAELYEGNRFTGVEDFANTDSQGKVTLELEPPNTGYYEIKVSMQHPEIDYEPDSIDVRVLEQISIDTFSTQSPQYDNEPIKVIVRAFKGDQPTTWDNFDLDDEYKGRSTNYDTWKSPSIGVYEFEYNLQGEGDLRFRVRATKDGYETDWTQYETVEVRIAEILFKNIDLPFSVCEGSHTGTFELVDSIGNPILGANVQLQLQPPAGASIVTPPVIDKGEGKYSFSHNYILTGGWWATMTATSGNLRGTSGGEDDTNPINILSCTGGGGGDGPDYLVYALIIGAILGLGGFIFIVFIRKKK